MFYNGLVVVVKEKPHDVSARFGDAKLFSERLRLETETTFGSCVEC